MTVDLAKWIPWMPALAAVLCGLCAAYRPARKLAAPIAIAGIFVAFVMSVIISGAAPVEGAAVVHGFNWLAAGAFRADFAYYLDPLTFVMLYVVTGVGTLVAVYASGYMKGDRGYARFFFGVSLFIFAMLCLVLADNLVLLYLGWEGVGLCSYLLIGYYYDKPSAVAAGKKAFIVNRIGDLGFALGIFLTWREFGTVQYAELFDLVRQASVEPTAAMQAIPFLLMLGAFGKSAQFPLHVWLPDAMEGPTPVSALIHAATMVTAGVYMITRLLPVFALSPEALTVVAIVGGFTALFAGTIALCQYDIKRIYAYSTVSQLGYMFLGIGAMSSVGAVFHLFTHAFFKALLFLTAGSVMHALTGQLDLRKMSGLREKMPVTCWLMFIGCLALAGVPPLAGFYSKDLIIGDVMARGLEEHDTLLTILGMAALLTAFLTAFYTFRLWFRVFMGPLSYEMGHDHHAEGDHDAHHAPIAADIKVEHHHEPHEMPWLMNAPLLVLAAGAVLAGWLGEHWMHRMIESSSAHLAVRPVVEVDDELFMNPHTLTMVLSILAAVLGIVLAAWFHLLDRPAADRVKARHGDLCRLLENKYFIDEIYDRAIVTPLRMIGHLLFVFDRMVIDGVVLLVSYLPRWLGLALQPAQRGVLQGYGLGMALGLAVLLGWMITRL
ncbi:MAG: NADH-quinone oxidoreductase subunit L [Phycisphaeraceae bacterium]|nr:NADH-quinone oxidoreductase subunit L [Phycisphaeraceae bacterium]